MIQAATSKLLEFPAPIGKLEGIGEFTPTIGEFSVFFSGGCDGSLGIPLGVLGERYGWGNQWFLGSSLGDCWRSVGGHQGSMVGPTGVCLSSVCWEFIQGMFGGTTGSSVSTQRCISPVSFTVDLLLWQ